MTGELFQTDPTAPTPLHQARARLEKAEAQMMHSEKMLRDKTPLDFYESLAISRELLSAENSVAVEETREIERLKQQTK